MLKYVYSGLFGVLLVCSAGAKAQEVLRPVAQKANTLPQPARAMPLMKTAANLTLPFYDDFSFVRNPDSTPGVSPYIWNPCLDASRWDASALCNGTVNNSFGEYSYSSGVLTLDVFDKTGMPYDSVNQNAVVFADSITSLPFDLGGKVAADSIFLSFGYQPGGKGFYPETQDSLMLYFYTKQNEWRKVWSVSGSMVKPFKQVILPVTDTAYLYDGFQFRLLNKGSKNTNDDIWNIDFVYMAQNRNSKDTLLRDIALQQTPTPYLGDYAAMPYRHYQANASAEQAAEIKSYIQNLNTATTTATETFQAIDLRNNNIVHTQTQSVSLTPFLNGVLSIANQVTHNGYTLNTPPADPYAKVSVLHKYWVSNTSPNTRAGNDTTFQLQEFDNYFAYDDGSAEQVYSVTAYPNIAARFAVKFHLNQPDTLRGVMIHFEREVPTGANKLFSLMVYKSIGFNGGTDNVVYQQDYYHPGYIRNINGFWTYGFDQPIVLPAGDFYIGTLAPILSNSDNLYYGWDANRIADNHLFYNSDGDWYQSTKTGCVMLRPVVGKPVTFTGIKETDYAQLDVKVFPNPASDRLQVQVDGLYKADHYSIVDVQGRVMQKGKLNGESIDVKDLTTGFYLLQLNFGNWTKVVKFAKI